MVVFHYTFTKNQLEILREIFLRRSSVSEIVGSSGKSSKTVYRNTRTLLDRRIITASEGRGAYFTASSALHVSALKRFLLSKERPIDALVGSKLLVLLSIAYVRKSVDRIAKETGLKRDTVRVLAWQLKNHGIVVQENALIGLSASDIFMKDFLQDFSRGVNLDIMSEISKTGVLVWSGGLEFIFSSSVPVKNSKVKKTGTSAMADYGVQFISEKNYYHYSDWEQVLRPEDIAIHNLLTDRFNPRVISYSMLLLKKTGFDVDYMLEESRYAQVDGLVNDIIGLIAGNEVTNQFLPDPEDFEDLMAQYGVK